MVSALIRILSKLFHCLSCEFRALFNQNLELINLYIKIHSNLYRQKFRPKTIMPASIPNHAETETGFLMYLILKIFQ